jgi:hypothetical protein
MSAPTLPRTLPIAAVLMTLAACSGGGGGPTDPGTEPPPPAISYLYTMSVTLDSIRISEVEACDGENLFGTALPGAFHYKVAVIGKGTEGLAASSGYGSVLGTAISRGPRGVIALGAKKFTFTNLLEDDVVNLRFSMIEWDGPFMDGVLKGQVIIIAETPGERGLNFSNPSDLLTGNPSTCGGRLFFRLEVTGKPK